MKFYNPMNKDIVWLNCTGIESDNINVTTERLKQWKSTNYKGPISLSKTTRGNIVVWVEFPLEIVCWKWHDGWAWDNFTKGSTSALIERDIT